MGAKAVLVGVLLALAAGVAAAEQGGAVMAFSLSSGDFEAGQPIPAAFSCDGVDQSPSLSWSNVPAGTQAFALICEDPDAPAGTWIHWVAYDIPAAAKGLARAVKPIQELPDGTRQGRNDFGRIGYGGPCPPRGKPHHYVFTVYALSRTLPLAAGARRKDLLAAMRGIVLGQAELIGTYQH